MRHTQFPELCFCLVLLSGVGACSNSNSNGRGPAQGASFPAPPVLPPSVSSPSVLSQTSPRPQKPVQQIAPEGEDNKMGSAANAAVTTSDEAKRLAEQHVALRKRSWGAVKNVSEDERVFYVSFDTPDQELKLLGPRVVMVDKQTGAATVQLRR